MALPATAVAGNFGHVADHNLIVAELVAARVRYGIHIVTPEQYGALGDGSTDDTAAIQAAIDDIATAGGGTLLLGTGSAAGKTYRLSSSPRTDRAGNAILALPTTGSGTIVIDGYGANNQFSGCRLRTTLTGMSYSGSFGPPSVIGGPTPENNAGAFSAWNVVIRGLSVYVPTNPTICGIDVGSMVRATLDKVLVSSENPISTLPTSIYQFGARLPKGLNFGGIRADDLSAMGQYTGVVLSSPHADIRSLITKWCFLGVGLSDDVISDGHASRLGMWQSEQCTHHLAGWNVAVGSQSNGGTTTTRLVIDLWDIEDAAAALWYTTTDHLVDTNSTVRGVANFNRTVSGVGPTSADLTTVGGGKLELNVTGGSAWHAFTPVVSGTGWALGNGTAVTYWMQRGKVVTYRGLITFGSTSTFGANPVDISLPVTAQSATLDMQAGSADLQDTSAATSFAAVARLNAVTTLRIRSLAVVGATVTVVNTSSTVPFTWATTDIIRFNVTYEAA